MQKSQCSMGNRLQQNQSLMNGESLESPNGHFLLVFQGDGNLVLYNKRYGIVNASTAMWSSKTSHANGRWVCMQMHGNLVMRDRTDLKHRFDGKSCL